MTPEELRELFLRTGALREGHFRLTSGLHSDQYFQCALLLSDPVLAERMGRALAAALPASAGKPETVVSPAIGGLIIGHEAARALGARSLFAERVDGRMTLRRGFSVRPGERVAVVEDVVTTGGSTKEVVALLVSRGAAVVAALSIVCRAQAAPDVGAPFTALAHFPAAAHEAAACPLCRAGRPVEKPGSRQEKPC
jgi:orotate phosphoribosyltransferase